MQFATQRVFKGEKPARPKKDARAGTIAAIHIVWKKLRPDLRHDKDELRKARLEFMAGVLDQEVTSAAGLSQRKLGKVLDAMRELERAPMLPNVGAGLVPARDRAGTSPAPTPDTHNPIPEIHHLATQAQGDAIENIFNYLGWSLGAREKFIDQRYQRTSARMLTPKQANSLTFILLRIAASRDIKRRFAEESGRIVDRVSGEMIRAEIPALKRRLGIDQAAGAGGKTQEAEEEEEFDGNFN